MPTDTRAERHRYHPLRVLRVVRETTEARSFVFAVPPELVDVFAYQAGQFVTLRVVLGGAAHLRSYSMSSSPPLDGELCVTVKRVPGGLISNWLNDTVDAGDVLEVGPPGGSFVLDRGGHDIVAFAAGSGITPILSIIRTALATSDRRVRVLYANRDRTAAIFGDELDALASQYPGRLAVEHHEDLVRGFVDRGDVARVVDAGGGGNAGGGGAGGGGAGGGGASGGGAGHVGGAAYYVCGPEGFLDVVEAGLVDLGADRARVHVERFTPVAEPLPAGPPDDITVTIRLGGRTVTASHRHGSTLLQTARFAGLRAPSSCETGSCATCMARLAQGRAEMRVNDALTPDEVAEGWVLTCQAVPVTPVVEVVYE
ncbi:Oxidoreductase FAD-binding domain protein [Parafrankia sp. EAN1pec]|uniref:ferredoxin--NADP reductase n=1 Tax=Parafrankia sp. (strain EAN1pec) TaxID=298653 RepID=UPI0000542CC2|nr:Oxidoreductase FAD-binding domain protein [Frankia sp. EAN1pec]